MRLGTIGISDEQVELMDVAERVVRDTHDITTTRDLLTDETGFDRKLWKNIVELGWTGIAIPEAFGGIGLGLAECVPVAEQLGRHLSGLPFCLATTAAQAVLIGGTSEQKSSILPQIIAGNIVTLALTELDKSFDLSDISTTANRTDDGYKLNGKKVLVQHFDVASHVILSALLDGKLQLFLCDTSLIQSSAVHREILIDETKRSYALDLDGLIIPESAKMNPDATTATLDRIAMAAALLSAAELVGGTQACLDYTLDYLGTRTQFGKPIGAYQALKHPTVDNYVAYEKARSLLYGAAHVCGDPDQGETAIRMARIAAGRGLAQTADRAIQFHGGFGFTYDCDAHLYRRRALFHDAAHGDTRWHKARLAARLFD